jgi:hypothetical protein
MMTLAKINQTWKSVFTFKRTSSTARENFCPGHKASTSLNHPSRIYFSAEFEGCMAMDGQEMPHTSSPMQTISTAVMKCGIPEGDRMSLQVDVEGDTISKTTEEQKEEECQ